MLNAYRMCADRQFHYAQQWTNMSKWNKQYFDELKLAMYEYIREKSKKRQQR